MAQFIDRRLNPRDKSLGNRQRFLRRTRAEVRRAVDKAVAERAIADAANGGAVSIPTDGIGEPQFHLSRDSGERERVLPGNKDFIAGDRIEKPKGGGGGSGRQASDSGGGEDPFSFALSECEFLDILFEDLELPDLVKASLKDVSKREFRRAGYTNDGATPNLAVLRTMRASMSRRLALRRPTAAGVERLEEELAALRAETDPGVADQLRIAELYAEIERLKRLQRAIPFIDPIDVRYNRFAPTIVPRAKAVMFCLMDVSASMGEREKDLAKRFFILLHLFLKRKYARVDIVFIRHTHEAAEVDEQEFFYGRGTGGTAVSSALKTMIAVRDKRYSPADWNVYCAQASDGDNSASDTGESVALLRAAILPHTQYYAYIEIADEDGGQRYGGGGDKDLWRGYAQLKPAAPNFALARVVGPRRYLSCPARTLRQAGQEGGRAMTRADLAPNAAPARGGLLFEGAEWDFATVRRVYEAIERIGCDELGLDVFPNQVEIISAEQMLDAYCSVGMPLMYAHWSYGKRFVRDEALYRRGYQALAYEIVINSNPCISYCMEENTMAMQTLVIAHAAFGHNHFFKNNYLFQQWSDPAGILDYLDFAKRYVASCEERHGLEAVERTLDAAHALMGQGVFRYRRAAKLKLGDYERRLRERQEREDARLLRPLANGARRSASARGVDQRGRGARAQAPSAAARRESALFPRKEQPGPAQLAARAPAHRAQPRAIFLSPAPDQADERGLRDLRPLHDRQPPLREGPDLGRRAPGNSAQPRQCRRPIRLRRSILWRDQPLRPRFRDDAGYQAHLRLADRGGPRVVPRHRRQAGLACGPARRMGELSRRIFRAAVPLAASHAQVQAVCALRQGLRIELSGGGDSQRRGLPSPALGARRQL